MLSRGTALAALLVVYLAISLRGLSVVPPVYEDEPWQASTGWKLANEGVFGSDLFAGFHGMERHYYGFMPMHPFFLAITFKIVGLGLWETRLETVAMGLLTLLLTYALARRLFSAEIGLLAVALLICARLTGTTRIQLTGIPLLDMARIGRYDMVVPVFGLLSLLVYLSARSRADVRLYVLAGLLAALAGLSHLYGVFWIVCLGLLALLDRAGRRTLAALTAGFVVPWLVYGAYVVSNFADWRAQTREYGPRFDLLDPSWYWHNVITEHNRYGPGLGPLGWEYLARPGFWIFLVALPAALAVLTTRAARGDSRARAIIVPALVFPAAFALLISVKLVNYTVTIVPLAMIAVAWAAVSTWQWAAARGRWWIRLALVGAFAAIALEGAYRVSVLDDAVRTTTPYAEYATRLRAHIPPDSRVLGLHNYWFGLSDLDYVSWLVPLRLADPTLDDAPSIERALDDMDRNVILIDARLRAYFDSAPPSDEKPARIRAWMGRRGFHRSAVVDDRTYGEMEIFTRTTAAP